jgi:hypothetical protein
MSWLSNMLHPGRAYDRASGVLDKSADEAHGYQQPYLEHGKQAGDSLQGILQQLMNPEELESKWSSGYEKSPYAKQLQAEALSSGQDVASSMGLGGSSTALSNLQTNATNIRNADRDKYMNDLMQKYMGAVGLGQNIYNTGANTANSAAQNSLETGRSKAGLQFGADQAGSSLLGNILGKGAGLVGQYLTGGFGTGDFGRGSFTPSWMH